MKNAVHTITDALDRDELCRRLDVKPRMIAKVRHDRMFPARWFHVVDVMCRDAGIECPRDAFNWQLPEPIPQEADQC